MKRRIVVRVEIFREGNLYIGLCPELDVSSSGETMEEARRSLREALEAFIEEREAMGTWEDVIEEAGFARQNASWLPRQPISAELVSIG